MSKHDLEEASTPKILEECAAPPFTRDVLIPHLSATLTMDWNHPPDSIRSLLDQVPELRTCNQDLRQVETKCGRTALSKVVLLANAGSKLTFEAMSAVQSDVVSSRDAEFRRGTAFTSARRERYAYFSSLEDMFQRKISTDHGDGCHLLIKAVRLYLDIVFFHPYCDGNSRAAILWFTFYCIRARCDVPDFRSLFGFGFVPGNRMCYWQFTSHAIESTLSYGKAACRDSVEA